MLIPYYTYRFFQPKYSIGVVGVVLNSKNEVLIVEHVFHPNHPWGLPGGWLNFNEDPAEAVMREIREELGLQVTVNQLLLATRTDFNHVDFAYLCSTRSEISKISYELLGYRWSTRSDLPCLHRFHAHAVEEAFAVLDKE
jgi:ADP-ribose pyrophosphatase YjhB (NUDIX family)